MTGVFNHIPNRVFNISTLTFLSEMETYQDISDLYFSKNLKIQLKWIQNGS